jgi:hypothetical protein
VRRIELEVSLRDVAVLEVDIMIEMELDAGLRTARNPEGLAGAIRMSHLAGVHGDEVDLVVGASRSFRLRDQRGGARAEVHQIQ